MLLGARRDALGWMCWGRRRGLRRSKAATVGTGIGIFLVGLGWSCTHHTKWMACHAKLAGICAEDHPLLHVCTPRQA